MNAPACDIQSLRLSKILLLTLVVESCLDLFAVRIEDNFVCLVLLVSSVDVCVRVVKRQF